MYNFRPAHNMPTTWYYFYFVIGWKISRHFLNQSELKPTPPAT